VASTTNGAERFKAGLGPGALILHWLGTLGSWPSWVGFRYLKSKKNSRFLSFITLMSILGVGLGVTSMIVVLSVMDGFEAELKKRLMASDVHVRITPTSQVAGFDAGLVPRASIDEAKVLADTQDGPRVDQFYPVVSTEAILRVQKRVAGVVLKGVGDDRLARVKAQVHEAVDPERLVRRDEKGETVRLAGVFVGQELAYELGLNAGEGITLISPTETEGPDSQVPRLKRYVIEGIYESGIPEQELHEVYTTVPGVQSFLRRTGVASQWEMTVKDFDRAPEVASDLRKVLPGFKVQDWIELNSHLFSSLRLERVAMSVILAFIVVVASFNIVTTLTLMVLEKKKDISILKAMGARDRDVASIFIAEGILIGSVGIGGGAGLGFLICIFLRKYPLIQLPDVFYDRTLPVTFSGGYYVGVVLSAALIVLAACLYPSWRAAKMNPLDGIRFG
jgi:lipoprotein-releasing system permease protein